MADVQMLSKTTINSLQKSFSYSENMKKSHKTHAANLVTLNGSFY